MSLLRHEFPDYPVDTLPPELLTAWRDQSWHNDTCPSFTMGRWHVFAEYPDPERRECGGKRYMLSVYPTTYNAGDSEGVHIASAEDWPPLQRLIDMADALREW